MIKQVEIISVNTGVASLGDMKKKVNNFLSEHKDATIEWFQTSVGSGSDVRLTAIITYQL